LQFLPPADQPTFHLGGIPEFAARHDFQCSGGPSLPHLFFLSFPNRAFSATVSAKT